MVAVKKKKPQRAASYAIAHNGLGYAHYANRNPDTSITYARVEGDVAATINTIRADMLGRIVKFTAIIETTDNYLRIKFIASHRGYHITNNRFTSDDLDRVDNLEALTKAVEDRIMLYLLGGQF